MAMQKPISNRRFPAAFLFVNQILTSKEKIMKSISICKKWLMPLIAVCALMACEKDIRENNLPEKSTTATDSKNDKINFNNWMINTVAGSDTHGYSGDGGPVKNALLNDPENVYVDKRGNIFITDFGNQVIREVDAHTGIIHTVAGNGINGYSGDGGPATQASMSNAFHIVSDDDGNLYISDLTNNRVRRIDQHTGIIKTIAGTGVEGFNGDGKAISCQLRGPFGINIDKKGNLIFSDQFGLCLRKMDLKTGMLTTFAGNNLIRGFAGDGGPATQASFNFIWHVAMDEKSGDIYVNDEFNYVIRKIDAHTGFISTVAGNGIKGNSGLGGPATQASFTEPVGVAIDPDGNVFISDQVLMQIYRVDRKTGLINLIAGNGTGGFFGDGGPAVQALVNHPNSLSFDPDGNLLFSDANNNRIRKIGIPRLKN
jgi:streptogramin lyase